MSVVKIFGGLFSLFDLVSQQNINRLLWPHQYGNCLVSLRPVVVTYRPVLQCYPLVRKCRSVIFKFPGITPRYALEQYRLHLKGNWPVISNQDLTWSHPIKTKVIKSLVTEVVSTRQDKT